MQARLSMGYVCLLASRTGDGMHQSALGINSTMRFHPKGALIAFFGRCQVSVMFLFLVLCRCGCSQQRRINYRTLFHRHAFLAQQALNLFKDGACKFMFFQQVPETKNRGFIRPHLFEKESSLANCRNNGMSFSASSIAGSE